MWGRRTRGCLAEQISLKIAETGRGYAISLRRDTRFVGAVKGVSVTIETDRQRRQSDLPGVRRQAG